MTPRAQYEAIAANVADQYGVTLTEIIRQDRTPRVVKARHEAFSILHARGLSSTQIGRIFKRNPTTVLHGIKRAHERIEKAQSSLDFGGGR